MRNTASAIYIFLFFLILIVPLTMWLLDIKEPYGFFDNRRQASMPEIRIEKLDPVPMQLDSFVNDHFPLRNTSIHTLNYWDARLFGKSPKPDAVIVGVDGWLFGGLPEIEFVSGIKPTNDSLITLLIEELNSRYEFCKENGAEFRLVIIPSKSTLYSEYLPFHYRISQQTSVADRLLERSKNECKAPILYLRDSLMQHKSSHQLYLKSDTHWNDYGAYYGYCSLINWLKTNSECSGFKPVSSVSAGSRIAPGDLSSMLGLGKDWLDTIPLLKCAGKTIVQSREKANYPCDSSWFSMCEFYELPYATADTSLPSVLVIRDSFANLLFQTLLASHFSRTTFIWDYWQHKLNKEIVLNEKPDVVLCVMNERFLMNPVKYPNSREPGGANFTPMQLW